MGIANLYTRFHFRRPYTPDILGGKASKKSNLMGRQVNAKFVNMAVISLYFLILIYILIFRIFSNIITTNEPEYYPLEIITTIGIVLSIIIIYFIFKEDKLKIKKNNIFYPILLFTFVAYYLAENNWLLGRDALLGIVIYGGVFGLVLLFGMKYIYLVNKGAGFIFGFGIILLCFGTLADATVDGYVPLNLGINRIGLIEEVCELYASLLFLHSFLLIYFNGETEFPVLIKNKLDLTNMAVGAAVFGFGNSFLLENHNRPIPMERIFFGLMIIAFALAILIFNFKKLISIDNSQNTVDEPHKVT